MNLTFEILFIASVMSAACALLGVFLVLRGIALMSDAISHAILPGIALMFLWTKELHTPLLLVGATCAGLLTVWLTQALINTERLHKDAALGLIFPLFFSVGIIVISQYARDVHLDIDMVLVGELAFAPFNRWHYMGIDCGPVALWMMSTTLLLNALTLYFFYKELSLTIVDQTLAHVLGFYPVSLYYLLMTLTSITTITAFDSVGAIVVVAVMIAPAATAFLLTRQLRYMLALSIAISVCNAWIGYFCAHVYDLSLAGCLATINGIFFFIVLLIAPERGYLAKILHNRHRNKNLDETIFITFLAAQPRQQTTLTNAVMLLNWSKRRTIKTAQAAQLNGLILATPTTIVLTDTGKNFFLQQQSI